AQAQMALMHPLDAVSPLREVFEQLLDVPEANRRLLELSTEARYPMTGAGHPLLGDRIPDVSLSTSDGKVAVSELLHAGRGVVLDLSGGELDVRGAVAEWTARVDLVQ